MLRDIATSTFGRHNNFNYGSDIYGELLYNIPWFGDANFCSFGTINLYSEGIAPKERVSRLIINTIGLEPDNHLARYRY